MKQAVKNVKTLDLASAEDCLSGYPYTLSKLYAVLKWSLQNFPNTKLYYKHCKKISFSKYPSPVNYMPVLKSTFFLTCCCVGNSVERNSQHCHGYAIGFGV